MGSRLDIRAATLGQWRARLARHVFVVGMARSGTTALLHTLESQRALGDRPEASPETFLFRPVLPLLGADDRLLDRCLGYLTDPDDRDVVRRLAEALARHHGRVVVPFRRLQARLGFAPRTRLPVGYRWLVRTMFLLQARSIGASRLLEKTPGHVHDIDEILRTFPRAKFVLSARHPVDAYASRRKRLERAEREGHPGDRRWLELSVEAFAESYRRDVASIRRAMALHPAAVRLLRYEDLVREPDAWLARLCAWLGFDYVAGVLDERPVTTTDPNVARPITASPPTWPDWMDPSEVDLLQDLLAVEMGELAYARHVHPDAEPTDPDKEPGPRAAK